MAKTELFCVSTPPAGPFAYHQKELSLLESQGIIARGALAMKKDSEALSHLNEYVQWKRYHLAKWFSDIAAKDAKLFTKINQCQETLSSMPT